MKKHKTEEMYQEIIIFHEIFALVSWLGSTENWGFWYSIFSKASPIPDLKKYILNWISYHFMNSIKFQCILPSLCQHKLSWLRIHPQVSSNKSGTSENNLSLSWWSISSHIVFLYFSLNLPTHLHITTLWTILHSLIYPVFIETLCSTIGPFMTY